jgi:hypothetical protein
MSAFQQDRRKARSDKPGTASDDRFHFLFPSYPFHSAGSDVDPQQKDVSPVSLAMSGRHPQYPRWYPGDDRILRCGKPGNDRVRADRTSGADGTSGQDFRPLTDKKPFAETD